LWARAEKRGFIIGKFTMNEAVQYPRAIARNTESKAESASRVAREKAKRAEYRKWSKEMKLRLEAGKARIFNAASRGAWHAVRDVVVEWASPEEAACNEAWFAILDAAGLAAETAAARVAGYETWAELEAAEAAQDEGS
jgi:hypothetical protein